MQGFCSDAHAAITCKKTDEAVRQGIDAQTRAGVVYVDEQSRYKTQYRGFNLPSGKSNKNQYDDDEVWPMMMMMILMMMMMIMMMMMTTTTTMMILTTA